MSKALVYFSHRLSSIGDYIFQVLFLTCLAHQQLLAFSSCQRFHKTKGGGGMTYDLSHYKIKHSLPSPVFCLWLPYILPLVFPLPRGGCWMDSSAETLCSGWNTLGGQGGLGRGKGGSLCWRGQGGDGQTQPKVATTNQIRVA